MTKKILLIDDNQYFLHSLSERIKSINKDYNVFVTVNSPKTEALEILGQESIDLIISDTRMFSIDNYGPRIINEIRAEYPDLSIVATGVERKSKNLWPETEYKQRKYLLDKNNPSLNNILEKYLS